MLSLKMGISNGEALLRIEEKWKKEDFISHIDYLTKL